MLNIQYLLLILFKSYDIQAKDFHKKMESFVVMVHGSRIAS